MTIPDKAHLVPGDFVTWVARYDDGTELREEEGAAYRDIDRSRLTCFCLVAGAETVLEAFPPPGASGVNLIYRRRTTETHSGERSVVFVVAYAPMGPAILVDPDKATYRVEEAFIDGDPDMYPPVPLPDEGERAVMEMCN